MHEEQYSYPEDLRHTFTSRTPCLRTPLPPHAYTSRTSLPHTSLPRAAPSHKPSPPRPCPPRLGSRAFGRCLLP